MVYGFRGGGGSKIELTLDWVCGLKFTQIVVSKEEPTKCNTREGEGEAGDIYLKKRTFKTCIPYGIAVFEIILLDEYSLKIQVHVKILIEKHEHGENIA
jgi:hypothetical protein